MAGVTWDSILSSSDYTNAVQQIQAKLKGQFKAIPSADPAIRQLPAQVAARQIKLQDIGHGLELGNRKAALQEGSVALQRDELGLKQQQFDLQRQEQAFRLEQTKQEFDLERKQTDRADRQRPWATALGFANVGLGGLSALGNIRAARRSEARGQQMTEFQRQSSEETRRALANQQVKDLKLEAMHSQWLKLHPTPEFPIQ